MEFLKGKKTYGIVLLGAIVWIAQVLAWMTPETAQQIWTLLGMGAVATIRDAIK